MRVPALVTALLFTAGLFMIGPVAHAQSAPEELGLDLIPWSKKVGERRYESSRDYEGTLKFFKDKFKGWKTVRWYREVALPSVKYTHIENTATAGKWSGVNVYLLPDGHVRYFILARPPKAKDAPPAPAPADPDAAAGSG